MARVLLDEGSLEGVETITDVVGVPRTAIVHRPYQVSTAEDVTRLAHAGERLVVSHLDLLLYHDSAYHRTPRLSSRNARDAHGGQRPPYPCLRAFNRQRKAAAW